MITIPEWSIAHAKISIVHLNIIFYCFLIDRTRHCRGEYTSNDLSSNFLRRVILKGCLGAMQYPPVAKTVKASSKLAHISWDFTRILFPVKKYGLLIWLQNTASGYLTLTRKILAFRKSMNEENLYHNVTMFSDEIVPLPRSYNDLLLTFILRIV